MTALHPPPPHPDVAAGVAQGRRAWADNLKVVLVAGVIVGHATMAWTGVGIWVVFEPPVREPLRTLLVMLAVVGGLFAMPLFFLLAGAFTPRSLARKGLRRFLVDRTVRLGVPVVAFVLLLTPVIEYVDADNAGFEGGFLAFVPTQWWPWPPAWGPLWFLAVLLVFSAVYAVARTLLPRRAAAPARLRGWHLATAALLMALASWVVRFDVPLAEEVHHLALGQAPGWVAGFVLGVLGAERGWYEPVPRAMSRRLGQVAGATVAVLVGMLTMAGALELDIEPFLGGGTWPSLVMAALEATLVVTLPLWLVEQFRGRFDHQGPRARVAGRAAFAAFVLHQLVLLGCVLATRLLPWPPEVEYVLASTLGVVASFGLGALLLRVPVVARVL